MDTGFTESVTLEDTLSLPLETVATKGGDDMSFKDISHNPERITSDDGNGWELLAAAIIEQAVKDYRISFFRQDSKEADVRKQAKQRMKEIERFISSKYFNTISLIEPKSFLKKLREKFEEEKREKEKKGKKHDCGC